MDSQRIYQGEDGQWYFGVRGNQVKGPFPTEHNASVALDAHIRQCRRHLDTPLWPSNWSLFKPRRSATSTPNHS
ncbi:MAG: hypothetical protein KDI31_16530 [Pseudomonadales bacterium]|nr:hypothetical protein [Pseudomonadales bacterium]